MHLFLALRLSLADDPPATPPSCPGLARLLHHADPRSSQAETIGELLAPRYGVGRQADWPFAPLCLAALGHAPADHWWVAADPVNVVAGRDDLTLSGRAAQLTPAESAELVARLNAHFAADGVVFVAPRPERWFLRAPRPMSLVTSALERAVGQPLFAFEPQGDDAALWRRWRSEIEMLLHEDPINSDRERRNLAPVNGIWLSGGGVLPPRDESIKAPAAFGSDEPLRALAHHAGSPHSDLPADLATAWDQTPRDRDVAIVIDDATPLAAFEDRWAGPAWRMLLRDELTRVTTIIDDGLSTHTWVTRRPGVLARFASRFAAPDLPVPLAPAGKASS